jgi:HAMP domain-containing protein
MRLHALSGRPERALAQYERQRDALQKDIGTRPTEATRRLRDEIAAGRLTMTPPAGSNPQGEQPSTGNHNLPVPRTSFVGRERKMMEVKRALSISERTAGNHVVRILRKLGLSSRTQIGALVVEDRPYAPPSD